MNELAVAAIAAAEESARTWIGASAIAFTVILVAAIAAGEKLKGWIGAFAGPPIDTHNKDENAHAAALRAVHEGMAQLEKAVAILNECVRSQQGQIAQIDSARKETLQLVLQQVQQAVDLLSRE